METTVRTIRAIGSELARRKVRSVLVPFAGGSFILVVIFGWLVHYSLWWLLLAVPLLTIVLLGIGLLAVGLSAGRALTPSLSSEQQVAVRSFVDNLERVSGVLQIPVFLIIFRLLRDLVCPRDTGFINALISNSDALRRDYITLKKLL